MAEVTRFPFIWITNALGESVRRPIVPIVLIYGSKSLSTTALIETGADVSVLPHGIGLELGANWDDQKITLELSGNLSRFEARGILISAPIGTLKPARLAFDWTQSEQARLILGQTNFFDEFAVCIHRFEDTFDIESRI
jgi:hypothetical protein